MPQLTGAHPSVKHTNVFSFEMCHTFVSGMKSMYVVTPKKTPPQAIIASEIYTKDRIYLTDPSRKFYTYMINCAEITNKRAQALLHAERAGATTTQTSERLTTTAIYTATKWCASLTKNMLSKNFLYYTHSIYRNLLQLPWVAEVPRVILIEYA